MQQKVAIIGGPSTGKSTVINELKRQGYYCMLEISREVTAEAKKKGIDQLFLSQPLLFSEMLLKGRINQHLAASKTKESIVFFDRGIPDIHAYLDYIGTDYPSTYKEKSNQYRYDLIFIMPPWKEIHTTDKERYENFEQALDIYHHLLRTYKSVGYSVIEVPKETVANRVEFILQHLSTH